MSASAQVARYLEHVAHAKGLAEKTVLAYRQDLELLVQMHDQLGTWPDALVLRRWVAEQSRADSAPRSIARRLSAWRVFFDWLVLIEPSLKANPVKGLRGPKAARLLPKAISPDQAAALMDGPQGAALQDVAFINARNQAMLELLYSSGLRLSELVGLDVQWFDKPASSSWLDHGQAQVQVLGKGRKSRMVPVGVMALQALSLWIPMRAERLQSLGIGDQRALFIGQQGTRLSARSVQSWVEKLARERGVPARIHPHVMRHSMASHVLQSSQDLRGVQELLGHANISTTQVYTALDFQHLAQVYDKAHPRAKKNPPPSG